MEKVRERLLRAARALDAAGVPYAVVGGNAVAAWVSRVDEAAVRNTRDVDVLLRRADLDAAQQALEATGFVGGTGNPACPEPTGLSAPPRFLDGPGASAREAVHVIFAGEKVRPDYALPAPDVGECEPSPALPQGEGQGVTSLAVASVSPAVLEADDDASAPPFRLLELEALVRMKLTSHRDKDRMHLRDLIGVGLIDATWPARYGPPLANRLSHILATPDG